MTPERQQQLDKRLVDLTKRLCVVIEILSIESKLIIKNKALQLSGSHKFISSALEITQYELGSTQIEDDILDYIKTVDNNYSASIKNIDSDLHEAYKALKHIYKSTRQLLNTDEFPLCFDDSKAPLEDFKNVQEMVVSYLANEFLKELTMEQKTNIPVKLVDTKFNEESISTVINKPTLNVIK